MIVYFDTSLLIKRYIDEVGSDAAGQIWSDAEVIATSPITYAETVAALARLRREQPHRAEDFDAAHELFLRDWEQIHPVLLSDDVNREVDSLVTRHALRSGDAIHLASAVTLRDNVEAEFAFACADQALCKAAIREGFIVLP